MWTLDGGDKKVSLHARLIGQLKMDEVGKYAHIHPIKHNGHLHDKGVCVHACEIYIYMYTCKQYICV